ncbi:ankyrin repeat domain-containing protein [Candidatus Dependentiae bacterium]
MKQTKISLASIVLFLSIGTLVTNTHNTQCMKKIKLKNPFSCINKFIKKQIETDKFFALIIASKKGDITKAKRLLKNGAKQLIGNNNYGNTAVHWACENDDLKMAKLLIKNGGKQAINIPLRTHYNARPLYTACLKNSEKMVKLLMKNGGHKSTDAYTAQKQSPLLEACYYNNLTICRMLIPYCKKTINMRAHKLEQEKNAKQKTPLYFAHKEQNLTLCKLLILNGAKIIRKNAYKITPKLIKDYNEIKKYKLIKQYKLTGEHERVKKCERIKKLVLIKKHINFAKTFDEAKSNYEKIKKILEKNKKNKYAYKFLLQLAFSRFLLENIENKKNICEMFFYKALINPKYSTKMEKVMSKYKKYILRLDMRRIAKKICLQYKQFSNNLNKLRNPKYANNPKIKPDLQVKCKHY